MRGVLLALLALMFISCAERRVAGDYRGEKLYQPAYASGFEIDRFRESDNTILTIKNPWQGADGVEKQVLVVRDSMEVPTDFNGTVVRAPLKRVICMSSSYVAFIDTIGEAESVKGVSGVEYMTNQRVIERHKAGEVADVGYDTGVDYERIVSLRPDAVFVYGLASEDTQIKKKLNDLGVSVIDIGEYVESTPLGKAEWLLLFGELFNKREQAEKTFNRERESYQGVSKMLSSYLEVTKQPRPRVMLNAPYRDVWFVPGDRSYMVRLIEDAGGEYVAAGDDSDRSRPIDLESAYGYVAQADVWLNPGQANAMTQLNSLYPRFMDAPSVEAGRVYNSTKRDTPKGGSDFWESGAVNPVVVLCDVVKILHPNALEKYELYYFQQLE